MARHHWWVLAGCAQRAGLLDVGGCCNVGRATPICC
ncbi:hypothetical protein ERO13_D05G311350v2 [Gossypium hirsutum]|nr:hypothetical protein ERO13_D05G311350v2 [Gossypium hirsutum]